MFTLFNSFWDTIQCRSVEMAFLREILKTDVKTGPGTREK